MRLLPSLIVLASLGATAPAANSAPLQGPLLRSATKARDIGGFTLGMHIRDAAKLASIESLGNDNYQAVRDSIIYDFQVTPKGRIYRVISTQRLEHFVVDESFVQTLVNKLTSKYGPPATTRGSTFGWSLVEPVKRVNGRTLPFETMWASSYVQEDPRGVSIEMKMIDFRILWHDQDDLDRNQRERGADKVSF